MSKRSAPGTPRVVACSLAAFALAACAPTVIRDAPDAGAEACSFDGAGRCDGSTFQRCLAGGWRDQARCDAPLVCDGQLACVQCQPSLQSVCVGDTVYACDVGGHIGAALETCALESCGFGHCYEEECPASADLIYAVDEEARLLAFDPRADQNTFTVIGPLGCPAGLAWPGWDSPATPFSMSVDRRGRAWILYTNGELFVADVATPAHCERLPFALGQQGFELFGLAFVADAPGATSQRLFTAGGAADLYVNGTPTTPPPARLGRVDPESLQLSALPGLGMPEHPPDLTGTGNGELYGYFPGQSSSRVSHLDRDNATALASWPMPLLPERVLAWAFAHYGGRFFVFVSVKSASGAITSQVQRLDPESGAVDVVVASSPYIIVGAGVSTCAPVIVE